jgi:hypothetical protein
MHLQDWKSLTNEAPKPYLSKAKYMNFEEGFKEGFTMSLNELDVLLSTLKKIRR